MRIKNKAFAGSLESSDCLVLVSPLSEEQSGLNIRVDSVVKKLFGEKIEKTVREVAKSLQVDEGNIKIQDRGALECTIRARVEAALKRAL